jgi:hypothetical protein
LLLHPLSPGFLADFFPEALAQRAGVGRKVQAFGFFTELDAFDEACHGGGSFVYRGGLNGDPGGKRGSKGESKDDYRIKN